MSALELPRQKDHKFETKLHKLWRMRRRTRRRRGRGRQLSFK